MPPTIINPCLGYNIKGLISTVVHVADTPNVLHLFNLVIGHPAVNQ